MRKRANPWPKQRRAHGDAAHIGWGYRRDRKKGPPSVMRYLGESGLSRSALRRYRKARKTKPAVLLAKRTKRRRKTGRPRTAFKARPFLVNAKNWYSKYVKQFARRHRGLKGPALMKAAARAYRGGRGRRGGRAAANQVETGQVYFNHTPRRRRVRARRGTRKGMRRKTARKAYRRNPVLPYFAFENKGRKRRRRTRARRNPILPYASFNPRRRRSARRNQDPLALLSEGLEQTIEVEFWTRTVLPLGAGFVFGQFAGGLVYAGIEKIFGADVTGEGAVPSIARLGSRMLGSVGVSALTMVITKDEEIAGKVLAGGLVAVLAGIIQEIFGAETYAKMTGMSDFGGMAQDLTEELKQRIAESVRSEIETAESGGGVSAFVSTQNLQTAPDLGPGPRVQGIGEPGMSSFVTSQQLQTAPHFQEYPEAGGAEPPVVSDISAFSDSFADAMLV